MTGPAIVVAGGPVAVDDRDAAARAHPGVPPGAARRPPTPGGILARAYGIPAVVAVRHALARLAAAGPDAEVALMARPARSSSAPDLGDRRRVRRPCRPPRSAASRMRWRRRCRPSPPTVSRSRCSRTSARGGGGWRARSGARGVGLFRTEFPFLERSCCCARRTSRRPRTARRSRRGLTRWTIRPLAHSFGGRTSSIPYLPLPAEENPFLGVRALRLAHDRPSCSSPSCGRATGRPLRGR